VAGQSLLGLDIGGSRSRARLCVGGELAGESEQASASLTAAGGQAAEAALADLLAGLPLDPARPVDAACAGSAGLSVPGGAEFLSARLTPLTRSGVVVLVTDAGLLLPAAGLTDGIALVCGTGSAALGSYRGREAWVGGWGYLLGDEGSGYWIVRSALRVLLDRRDRRAPPGDLGDALLAAAGVPDVPTLHRLFYSAPQPRRWARYAPVVLNSDDPEAIRIAAETARSLAGLAATAARRLAAPPGLPVVLAGGLTRHAGLVAAISDAIAEDLPGSEPRLLAEPPVAGAVRLAAQAAQAASRPS
jgi:N-acetylglucosamine kinase-like BadF-type ATPase